MSAIDPLAPRILALPADIRDALARVDGPGWVIRPPRTEGAPPTTEAMAACSDMRWLPTGSAFFSANPAASVAAVLGCPIYTAHYRLYQADATGDDHAAALSIIEAHVAGRGPS